MKTFGKIFAFVICSMAFSAASRADIKFVKEENGVRTVSYTGAFVDDASCNLKGQSHITLTYYPSLEDGLKNAVVDTTAEQCFAAMGNPTGEKCGQRILNVILHITKGVLGTTYTLEEVKPNLPAGHRPWACT